MRIPEQRRQELYRILRSAGALSTRELARQLGVSEATVRRDLAQLAKQGLLQRSYGGALLPREEPPYHLKVKQNLEVKQAIARKASSLIRDGETIILDSGTTILALAHLLGGRPIRAITLDLPVAQALAKGTTEVFVVGGRVRNGFYSLVGPWVEELLSRVRADIFLMGADAFDQEGVTNYTFEEASIKRLAMRLARRRILLADATKWGRRAPAFVAPWEEIDLVITDLKEGLEGVKKEVVNG